MNPWNHEAQQQDRSSLLEDRRSNERTAPVQEGTHIWLDDQRRICVELVDESCAGIGVLMPDMSFTFGPRIRVDFNGELRTATVAHLNRTDDGQYRLGLEWVQVHEA